MDDERKDTLDHQWTRRRFIGALLAMPAVAALPFAGRAGEIIGVDLAAGTDMTGTAIVRRGNTIIDRAFITQYEKNLRIMFERHWDQVASVIRPEGGGLRDG